MFAMKNPVLPLQAKNLNCYCYTADVLCAGFNLNAACVHIPLFCVPKEPEHVVINF